MPPRRIPEQLPISAALRKSVLINRIDQPNQVAWTEWRANIASGCPADPYSLVMTNASGKIDPCLIPATSGLLIEVGGVTVPDQSVLNFIAQTGIAITYDAFGGIYIANTGASSTSFTDITNGTNIQATMVVGTGASLSYTGSGVVDANEIGTINVDGNLPTHAGMVLVSQPGNATALWADPQVQGLYAEGSNIASPPAYTPPTTIQPVLIGGKDNNGLLRDIATTPSGAVIVVSEDEADDANHFAWNTGPDPTTVPNSTLLPLISIRPQAGATTIVFFLTGLDIFMAPSIGEYQLLKNGVLTGASFANVPNSNAQEDTVATVITGGTRVDSGITQNGVRTNVYSLSFGIPGGTPDIFTLACQCQTSSLTKKASGALRWTEQTQPL